MMQYSKDILLKSGISGQLRSGRPEDGRELLAVFLQVQGETDYLLSYPEENTLDL